MIITIAVDDPEWADLYENPEDKNSPHKIKEGSIIEVQLWLSPKQILHYWNKQSSSDNLTYLDIDPKRIDLEPNLVFLKRGSNLCFFLGIVRRIAKRSERSFPGKQDIDILLDCKLPIVINEIVNVKQASRYVEEEGDFLLGMGLLFGSVAFSGTLFKAPIIGKVRKIAPLDAIPAATLLELELQPIHVIPEIRVSYYEKSLEEVKLDMYSP